MKAIQCAAFLVSHACENNKGSVRPNLTRSAVRRSGK